MLSFLIADDHEIVVLGIEDVLKQEFPDAEVHSARTFPETLEAASKQKFDLIILDITFPGGGDPTMIKQLRKKSPHVKILMISAISESVAALPFIFAGANGFISKLGTKTDIMNAVKVVLNGDTAIGIEIKKLLINFRNAGSLNPLERLTKKELKIATMLRSGKNNTDICEELNLRPSTISTFKTKIFDKLEVKNTIELDRLMQIYQNFVI
jgi:DNA-binding NarL/FixJ family response regulator